jgi:hypothetical protein
MKHTNETQNKERKKEKERKGGRKEERTMMSKVKKYCDKFKLGKLRRKHTIHYSLSC